MVARKLSHSGHPRTFRGSRRGRLLGRTVSTKIGFFLHFREQVVDVLAPLRHVVFHSTQGFLESIEPGLELFELPRQFPLRLIEERPSRESAGCLQRLLMLVLTIANVMHLLGKLYESGPAVRLATQLRTDDEFVAIVVPVQKTERRPERGQDPVRHRQADDGAHDGHGDEAQILLRGPRNDRHAEAGKNCGRPQLPHRYLNRLFQSEKLLYVTPAVHDLLPLPTMWGCSHHNGPMSSAHRKSAIVASQGTIREDNTFILLGRQPYRSFLNSSSEITFTPNFIASSYLLPGASPATT